MAVTLPRFGRKKETKEEVAIERSRDKKFSDYPHLMRLKPTEGYFFRSDYFDVDDQVGCILNYFHSESASDNFPAFWGINRIPNGLPDSVTVIFLEQVERMGKSWIDSKIAATEKISVLDEQNARDAPESGKSRRARAKVNDDVEQVGVEIQNGASYLNVHDRLLIKAPTVEVLDEALALLDRMHIDRLGTLNTAPYPGEARQELATLFSNNEKKRGRGFHYTSTEFAGSHFLVTHGLDDPRGVYCGTSLGDVNSSAVLFDVNRFKHHVVVATNLKNPALDNANVSDMWGSKISQRALLDNGRVVHLILDHANLDVLGPRLDGLTHRIDMNTGDVNMFELFGDQEDELALFSAHIEKIVLMAEQTFTGDVADRTRIRGALKEELTRFYVDQNMWTYDAANNKDDLRLVGLPHEQVPRLQVFTSYLDRRYRSLLNDTARDDSLLSAVTLLRMTFNDLLDTNGHLFNTTTKSGIDGARQGSRVIYDFSRVLRNGRGVAMAQFVNVIGFAVDDMGEGDVVIVHGAEEIVDNTLLKNYVKERFRQLYSRGGRVAFIYNSVEEMIKDYDLNRFDTADYTLLGPMTEAVVESYEETMKQALSSRLRSLITQRDENHTYLRRGFDNVVFRTDLTLGMNPKRADQRAVAARASAAQREMMEARGVDVSAH